MARKHILPLYSGAVTGVLAFLLLTGATAGKQHVSRLEVERIDVVEPDGTLRMAISNRAQLPGYLVDGKEQPGSRPQAGLIFYNDEGAENGGLIFGGRRNEKGQVVDAGGSLSFDRYGANQLVQLAGVEDSEDRFAGLSVTDSLGPSETHRRVWVGRGDDGAATLALMDAKGVKRLLMKVTADGATTLSVLDAEGKVVRELLPPTTSR